MLGLILILRFLIISWLLGFLWCVSAFESIKPASLFDELLGLFFLLLPLLTFLILLAIVAVFVLFILFLLFFLFFLFTRFLGLVVFLIFLFFIFFRQPHRAHWDAFYDLKSIKDPRQAISRGILPIVTRCDSVSHFYLK